jgi:hypothetical protein
MGSYQFIGLNSMTAVGSSGGGYMQYTYDLYANLQCSYLTLGHFNAYGGGVGFLYFDDISLIDLGPYEDLCPPNRLFQNVSHLTNKVYYVQDYIRSGYNVGASGSTGIVYVNTSLPVVYQAGNYIDLEPGFDMHPGSNFIAHIAPCSANPCNESVAAPPDKTIEDCGNNAFQISTDFSFTPGATIKWSPSTHLSSNSGPSVFFNPPSGSGQITYTITYTNACMKSAQQKVIVKYSNNPSAAAPVVGNVINDEYQLYFEASSIASSEWISVNITDAVSGNHVDSTGRLLASSDYDPMFPFEYSAPLFNTTSVCGNYHIELNVKNVCNSHISSDVIEWNRSAFCNPKPQIVNIPTSFSPNGDGVDDQFCIEVCGVDEYEVEVRDIYGGIVYSSLRNAENNLPCVWDGQMLLGTGLAPPNDYNVEIMLKACGNVVSQFNFTITLLP